MTGGALKPRDIRTEIKGRNEDDKKQKVGGGEC